MVTTHVRRVRQLDDRLRHGPGTRMGEIRDRLRAAGIEPYDCLPPETMDVLAAHDRAQAVLRQA